MERIQEAISKARERRKSVLHDFSAQEKPTEKSIADTIEVWDALPFQDVKWTRLANNRVISDSSNSHSKTYDALRTKVWHQMKANKWTRLAIVSPHKKDGKTTTALNLALSISRQVELRTILIDADLREPHIAKCLNVKLDADFSDVLEAQKPAESRLFKVTKGLALGLNKNPHPYSAEILQSVKAGGELDKIEKSMKPDILIFDTSAMMENDDALALLDQVDCALLVGRAEKTTLEQIKRCEEEIRSCTNMIGVVLNKTRFRTN